MKTEYQLTQLSDGSQPAIHGYFDIYPESPDGKTIAYTKLPHGDEMLCRVVLATCDGRERREIGPPTTGNFHSGARPQWLDEDTVAFAVRGEDQPETACVSLSSGSVRNVPGALRMYSPSARLGLTSAHEGRIVGMQIEEAVFLMDIDKGTLRKVMDIENVRAVHPLADRIDLKEVQFKHTKWSIDGRHFFAVFHNVDVSRKNKMDSSRYLKSIIVANADGTGIRYLTEFGHHPAWDPSGDVITGEKRPEIGTCLVRHSLDGGEPTVFARETGSHTSISPDGRFLATDCYDKTKEGWGTVKMIEVETGIQRTLAEFRIPELPYEKRCHAHPVWSRDGKRVYFNCAETGMAQLYAVDLT